MSILLRPATLLALSLCVVQAASRQRDGALSAAIADLVRTAGHSRVTDGRLTGGFAHGDWAPDEIRVHPSSALVAAATHLANQLSPDAHWALVARLFLDEPEAVRRVAARALDGQTPTAAFASDLAALELTPARDVEEGALDAARALDHAQQALTIAPQHPEALFNRAVAFERLGFDEAAALAWDAYLAVDGNGPWALEARRRSQAARQPSANRFTPVVREELAAAVGAGDWTQARPLVTRIPQAAREYLDDGLLPAWAEAVQRHDANGAARALAQIREVADLLMARHGELAWRDLAEAMARDADAASADLADALIDLREVRRSAEDNRVNDMWTRLDRTEPRVARIPPLRAAVRFWRMYVQWYRNEREQVAVDGAQLAQDCERDGFLYLQGRALNLLASTLNGLTRYAVAQAASRHAAEVFTRIGEREFAASAQASLGGHLAFQGDLRLAWTQQRRALSSLRDIDSLRRRFVVLGGAVVLATRFGLPYAALALQERSIEETRRWGDAGGLARQLLERARLLLDLDRRADARDDLVAAGRVVDAMKDAAFRAQFDTDLGIARARLEMHDDPADAARLLGETIDRLRRTGRLFQLTELYLARGRALAQTGQGDAALAAWLEGIARFEEQRADLRDEQLRISHFARAWELYREAMVLLVSRGEHLRALALVERGHARALLDSILPTQTSHVAAPQDVAKALPDGALVLVYHTLPRELLVWSLDRGGIALDRVAVTPDELRRLTTRLADRPEQDLPAEALDRLGRVLLGPVAVRLSRARNLAIVPDALVASVPFAALPMPGAADPLAVRLPLTIAPSLSLLELASTRLAAPREGPLRAAFFADPALAPGRAAVPRLVFTRREIAESASVYSDARSFDGRDATETRLLDAMGTVDVLHFAGHAIGNPEYPSRARLLASADESGATDGDVLPQEIAARKAPRARLVLLSACATATGTTAFGEGALSLARPFLAAGVPQVIGTLWDIDDRAGGALMPRFHHWHAQGVGAAEALRRAQIELRASGDPLHRRARTWAAFVVMGGLNGVPESHARH